MRPLANDGSLLRQTPRQDLSPALDRMSLRWAIGGHSGCPGQNECQFKTSTALLQGRAGRSQRALRQEKAERKEPSQRLQGAQEASFPSEAGLQPGRRESRAAPDVENFAQQSAAETPGGPRRAEECAYAPPGREDQGIRAGSLARRGKGGARVAREKERDGRKPGGVSEGWRPRRGKEKGG